MNADIRIYPDKEMYAVDMAELMHASIPESGVLQGCELTFSGGNVNIKPGRLVIKGRLAVILTEGIIEPASTVSSTVTGHICAICNLSDQSQEYVKLQILPESTYNSMVSAAKAYETGSHGDTFNVSNGVALLELGTITMTASGLSGTLTLTAAGKAPKNIRTYVEGIRSALQKNIDAAKKVATDLKSTVDDHTKRFTALFNHFDMRAHDSSKFMLWNITYPHATVAAKARVTVTFDYVEYGTTITWANNKNTATRTYHSKNKTYDTPRNSFGYRTKIKDFDNYGPQYLKPISIAGLLVRDAASGGKNSKDCSVLGWRFDDNKLYVDLYNSNTKEAAIVQVLARVLYVQKE